MPRLQPAHEGYWSHDPSPLGLYWYTANDIEQEATSAVNPIQSPGAGGLALEPDSGISTPTSSTIVETDATENEDLQESPRKRRRIAVDGDGEDESDTALTVEYARCTPGPSPTVVREELSAPVRIAALSASWSFRALDEDATPEALSTAQEPLSPVTETHQTTIDANGSTLRLHQHHGRRVSSAGSQAQMNPTDPEEADSSNSAPCRQEDVPATVLTTHKAYLSTTEDQHTVDFGAEARHESRVEESQGVNSPSTPRSPLASTADMNVLSDQYASIQYLIVSDDYRSVDKSDVDGADLIPHSTPEQTPAAEATQSDDSQDEVHARPKLLLESDGTLMGPVGVSSRWP